ncbi:E1-E2 ATPase-domain-containing protein, partial [Globomyces pollinis-pini]
MHAKRDLPYEELDESILQTDTTKGLTDAEVEVRLEMFGKNELPEVKVNPWLKFLGYFLCPTSLLFELACILSVILKEYPDLFLLVPALIANAFIRFFQEAQAESALDALKSSLTLKTRAWRNGKLVEVEASLLVPGDIIAIRVGDIIPADCRLLGISVAGEITEAELQIDQSSLAGTSSPVIKGKGHIAYSSSIVEQGAMLAIVTKTGIHTYIGRANLICSTNEERHSQKVTKIVRSFLVIIIILTLFMSISVLGRFLFRAFWIEVLKRIVFIAIAAIPLGLPTVMSVIMAVGVKELAKQKVILKRLTAIEDLASISILCSAKTGTLTSNKLSIDKPYLANKVTSTDFFGNGDQYTEDELLLNSFLSSDPGSKDPIESVIRKTAQTNVKLLRNRNKGDHHIPGYKVNNFTPFNPSSKYSEGKVSNLTTGEQFRVIKGAPQVIIKLCGGHQEAIDAVNNLAAHGFRALGVAKTVDEEMTRFELIGLISIVDPPRKDSAATIQECNTLGVNVKMITGDQQVIAKEVAHRLGMQKTILDARTLVDTSIFEEDLIDRCVKCDGFAHVIPENKYQVVHLLQKRGYLVGMIGDGVNDVPALKKANVGIAVDGCTEAARSAADIVLLDEGLSTIVDGI